MKRSYFRVATGLLLFQVIPAFTFTSTAQGNKTHWAADGYQYYQPDGNQIAELDTRDSTKKSIFLTAAMLTPAGRQAPLQVARFYLSQDGQKVLIFTNTKRVWRYNTRGDFWVYDFAAKTLTQLGKARPASSLQFAKLSPDGKMAAYVSEHNIYAEDLASGKVKQLTKDGSVKLINGTFDWAYEEEFDCRDGFRWAPDGHAIAYWQIDASKIKNYLMLNTTDSIYPFVKPVEYPVAGEDPSLCRIGVVDVNTGQTSWMKVPGDAIQHYIPRMEWWEGNANQLILEQLNRAQNESKVFVVNTSNGTAVPIHEEHDKAWIDTKDRWNDGDPNGWEWVNNGKGFIWVSEKDGWRHLYMIDRDGKEKLITKEPFDIISLNLIDNANGYIYFTASPDNATQKYLYRVKLTGGKEERLTPVNEPGTNEYEISPNGKIGLHTFSNIYTSEQEETISLPDHKHMSGAIIKLNANAKKKPEFFKVKTASGIEMDGWMVKPTNFDPSKKVPDCFLCVQ